MAITPLKVKQIAPEVRLQVTPQGVKISSNVGELETLRMLLAAAGAAADRIGADVDKRSNIIDPNTGAKAVKGAI